jgi:L-iditol 2-dehydrogenase
MCEHFPKSNIHPHGFAEYIRIPPENVEHETHHLPDHMSFEEGTLIEPLACVVKGIKLAGIQPGDTVAVVGAGLMGLGFTQLARVWGAGKIVAFDFSNWRLDKAVELGADHSVNPREVEDPLEALKELNEGRGADSVIVTPNGVKAYEFGLMLAGKGATVHLFSPSEPDETITLRPNDLFFREITLTTTYSCTHIDTSQSLRFLASGRLDGKAMVTHRWGLHQVAEAISTFLQAEDSIKSVIIPDLTPGVGEA